MISERYLCKDKVRISCRKMFRVGAVTAVRNRLMNAVFFFSDESRELLVGKMSITRFEREGYQHRQRNLPLSPAQARALSPRNSPRFK